jgi:hypothetical protein
MKVGRTGSIAAALLLATAAAKADQISVTGFSFSGPIDEVSFAAFDPSLGTLDSVSIMLLGTFDVLLAAPPDIGIDGPVSYADTADFGQNFTGFGLAGFRTTLSLDTFPGDGMSDGVGDPNDVIGAFDYTITFNAASDLTGFGDSSDGSIETGTLAGFLAQPDATTISEIILDEATAPLGTVEEVTADGSGIVTYSYTPASSGPPSGPASVPEPSSLALFAPAILAMVRRRRARP